MHPQSDPEPSQPPLKRRRGGEVGRDWTCPQEGCDKAFKSKKAQQDHIRVNHEGSRNFNCPKEGCTRSFGYKHVMQRHMERHHRETATPAPAQPPASNTIGSLSGQQCSAKNRPRVIACPWPDAFGADPVVNQTASRCAFRFSRAYDLRRHLKSTHGLEAGSDEVNAWVLKQKC
ncbi:Strongly-conserved Zn-finger binding protein (TFIIIA) [Ceratobasidium sp. 428]|nr:Strongly-conserved Zn-finger binding protein (TFIIIA) [Ceratobasidium sp. 428]